MTNHQQKQKRLPLLPLRDIVVFPYMVTPLFIGRKKSKGALQAAMKDEKQIILVGQKDGDTEDPEEKDLHSIGVIAKIIQLLEMPDGNIKVLVEGVARCEFTDFEDDGEMLSATQILIQEDYGDDNNALEHLTRITLKEFKEYVQTNKKLSNDLIDIITDINEYDRIADTIASHLSIDCKRKQTILSLANIYERMQYVLSSILFDKEIQQIDKRIHSEVKKQVDKNQRNYYLTEQIKALQKELGQDGDGFSSIEEIELLKQKVEAANMPLEAKEKTLSDINKLKMMSAMSPEATVYRSYIDWMLQMPWSSLSSVKKDLTQAQKILDSDHYGLERVKERILEYLAVQSRLDKIKGPILCLVGPPGVGKTSLGKSIAKATGRNYTRMALGGVRDEAEIRGHRKTYIGSLPGKLMQKIAKVGVKNPLFLLDEIDKMATDMRGDPASALLEVLDPEQNNQFNDHYLEVDFDLSDVMFVATSNSMNIPAPLLDRMEVIRLSGYTEDEKLHIATQHLVGKQKERNGLKSSELVIKDDAILDIIRYYTREAGVRGLEREIAKICRKAVKILLTTERKRLQVSSKNLYEFLGVKRFEFGKADTQNRVGEVTGLAWTEVGGDLLTIECASMVGKGKLNYTGSLGDVMKESIQAAMTVVRSRADRLGIDSDFYEKRDIHIHVPDGATPKDGPSAGIAMCTALVSCLTGNPVNANVAMTGEVSLHGKVLPIGGLKEKLLAAHRGGIKTVLIPKDNVKDLEEIPHNAKEALDIRAVETIDEVLELALQNPPLGIAIK